jgi:hypothetical protein
LFSFFTPFITKAIDFRYGYVFAGCNLAAGIGVYFFVIEGQGRTIEEIDTMYLLGVKPWESAKWVMPNIDEADPKMKQRLEAAGANGVLTERPGDNTRSPDEESGEAPPDEKKVEQL